MSPARRYPTTFTLDQLCMLAEAMAFFIAGSESDFDGEAAEGLWQGLTVKVESIEANEAPMTQVKRCL